MWLLQRRKGRRHHLQVLALSIFIHNVAHVLLLHDISEAYIYLTHVLFSSIVFEDPVSETPTTVKQPVEEGHEVGQGEKSEVGGDEKPEVDSKPTEQPTSEEVAPAPEPEPQPQTAPG